MVVGERSVNQGPWLRKEDACIFKNNAAHQRAFAGTALHLRERGST